MRKKIFLIAALFAILFSAAQLYALNISFTDNSATVTIDYFPSAAPGDPVFVRLSFDMSEAPRYTTSAVLEFYRNNKKIRATDFYFVNSDETKKEMLAGIPLSTYLLDSDVCFLKVIYKLDEKQNTVSMPLTITEKKFFEEVIPLNETNTAIRTDTSAKRMDQIDRLNKIYATTDTDGVHTMQPFITPVPADTRRSSFFGDRRTYVYSDGKRATSLHFGPDFAVPTGTKIISPARGKVVMAEDRISTGWSIVIEHLPGLYSIYYHMSRLDVKTGQMVSQGDLLGLSGATGMVTGPHLHWEMRLLGEAVSPDFFVGDFIPLVFDPQTAVSTGND